MNLLHTIGLMTRAEHEALAERFSDLSMANCDARAELAATEALLIERENELAEERIKFKRAATDLAAQAVEIAEQKGLVAALTEKNVELVGRIETLKGYHRRDTEEINALRPDAEAMRKKRAADRKRMAGKRNG